MTFNYMAMLTPIIMLCQFEKRDNNILTIIYEILSGMEGYWLRNSDQRTYEKNSSNTIKVFVELTTDTNVALDISGISFGGGESPVRFKFGLRKYIKRIMQWQ